MFLSKKNAVYFNKPKATDPRKPPRVLAGSNHFIQVGRMMNSRNRRITNISPRTTRVPLLLICY